MIKVFLGIGQKSMKNGLAIENDGCTLGRCRDSGEEIGWGL